MNVKRSSSSIARDGVVERLRVRVAIRAPRLLERREVGVGEHVLEAGKRRRVPPRSSPAAPRPRRGSRPPPSARRCTRRPAARSSRRSQRRQRRRARGRSRRAPTRATSARGSRTRRPCGRRGRAVRSPAARRARPPRPTRPPASRLRLDEVRGTRIARDRVAPEAGDGAVPGHLTGIYPQGTARTARNTTVPP